MRQHDAHTCRTFPMIAPASHSILQQPYLNHAQILLALLPNLLDVEPGVGEELAPLGLGAFEGAHLSHHVDVRAGAEYARVAVRNDEVVDQELAVARREGRLEVLEDSERFHVGPVVEDVAEEVELCAWIGVWVVSMRGKAEDGGPWLLGWGSNAGL